MATGSESRGLGICRVLGFGAPRCKLGALVTEAVRLRIQGLGHVVIYIPHPEPGPQSPVGV